MTSLSEYCLRKIARVTWRRRRRYDANAQATPAEFAENYILQQFSSSRRLFGLYPGFDPRGKRILEMGCGLGGRTAYLATQGAAEVVGVGINSAEVLQAQSICKRLYPQTEGRLKFVATEQGEPLAFGRFDYVLLVDTIEHVISPSDAVRQAALHSHQAARSTSAASAGTARAARTQVSCRS